MTTGRIALIAGSTGIVGGNLAALLVEQGWTVYGLARRRSSTAGVIPLAADLRERSATVPAQGKERYEDNALAGAVVDKLLALLAEVQGLAQAGLAGVEAVDDLLEALDRVLVAGGGAVSHDDLLRFRVRDQQRFGRRLVHR